MKKLLVLLLVIAMAFSTFALVACNNEPTVDPDKDPAGDTTTDNGDKDDTTTPDKDDTQEPAIDPNTKVGYGVVHEVYVCKTTITEKDGDVTAVEIDEVCLPYYAWQRFGSDYVGNVTTYNTQTKAYKEFKFNGKTWTLDETVEYADHHGDCKGDWKNEDGVYLLATLYTDPALCEAWFNAVINDEIYTLTGPNDYTNNQVLSSATLYKPECGYWLNGIGISWRGNVDATCAYVVANDLDTAWFERQADSKFIDADGVVTGATWIDMYDYINLMCRTIGADEIAAKPVEPVNPDAIPDGDYVGTSDATIMGTACGIKVTVTVKDNKVTAIVVDDAYGKDNNTGSSFGTTWDAGVAAMIEKLVGMTTNDINAITSAKTEGAFVAGTTLSSDNLIKAIQNALAA